MFYSEKNDKMLRFGDVVRGFACGKLLIEQPFVDGLPSVYRVEVCHRLAIVLSPCCAIRDGYLQLAPLQQVEPNWYLNSSWINDLTVINKPMEAREAVPPYKWDNMDPTERTRRVAMGKQYTLADYFVYAPNSLLGDYEISCQRTTHVQGHYAVDFRAIVCVKCPLVIKPEKFPIETKLLQLSKETRASLRDKLSYYYGKTPEEDAL
ncbi:MAG TPA: hypothetical protein VMX97_07510 [Hyphomicrobiaceae bacterium]|nr:hypothetical protein [Hyphomicrobiaceae bacterium]